MEAEGYNFHATPYANRRYYTSPMTSAGAQAGPFQREIELDFVRGIAILMVLDFHCIGYRVLSYPFQLLGFKPFGWAGVAVFFVLSGFLVGGLLVKEWTVSGQIDSKSFLIRRGFKILPQYYVFLILMQLSGHRSLDYLWGNFLSIQNYVGGIPHTWSLAVEEHAYLLLVLCFAVAAHCQARMRSLFLLFAAVAVCVSAMRLITAYKTGQVSNMTHLRLDGIMYGVLLAILYHYAPDLFQRMQQCWWLWLGALAAALAFFRLDIQAWWAPTLAYDFAILLGIALLMLLSRRREGKKHAAIYRLVAWIGFYSYGIYLWHVSVLAPIQAMKAHVPGWLMPLWLGLGPVVAGTIAGVVATQLVEIPMLKLRDGWFPRGVDSAVGIPAGFMVPEMSA
jgi:peptidoglycan/LPS O-acetylase OafA/YrhL